MHSTWRTPRLAGVAALAALGLVLASTPANSAEETGTKNLSTPVILVDDDSISAGFNPVTVPGLPTGTADYTKAGVDYYTSVGSDTYTSTVDQSFTADKWGADRTTSKVSTAADVKWGDNLMTHSFSGQMKQPIRVEVNLFANAATAAKYPNMLGYPMVSLEGTHDLELFGTTGKAAAATPMVYTPKATLSILKYDPATRWYSTVILPATAMTGEVNGSGKLIYGFNWGKPSGLAQPGVGNYRLVFKVADSSLVTLDKALLGESTETVLHTPYVYGNKVSYLDIGVGTSPLEPPLSFMPPQPKTDFNGDGNADVVARNAAGQLYVYPGNGASGWLPPILVGGGWNIMTAIVAPGDFNGDGKVDVLARDTLGDLYLYPGTGTGHFAMRVKVGSSWNSMTAIFGPGDFNGDGFADVLARATTGVLYLYPGNGHGGWLPRVQVGTSWNTMTAIFGPGDFSGDRRVDVIARNSYGQLLLYRGSGTAGWLLPPWLIGTGWNGWTFAS